MDTKETKVESVIEKLRREMQQVAMSPNQEKNNSIRKTVSVMESHLEETTDEFETTLLEVGMRQKEEADVRIRQYETVIGKLKCNLQEIDNKMYKLKGRLNECTAAQKEASEELSKTKEFYKDRVRELEMCISEGRKDIEKLKRERKKSGTVESSDRIGELQNNLQNCREDIRKLEDRLELFVNEAKEKEFQIEQLDEAKSKLVATLEAAHKENDRLKHCVELSESKQEISMRNNKKNDVQRVLEEQLSKIQGTLEETKKSLNAKVAKSEKTIPELEKLRKENILLRCSIRSEKRQKQEIDEKLEKFDKESGTLSEKVVDFEQSKTEVSKTLAEMQNEADSLKKKIDGENQENEALIATKQELNQENKQHLEENAKLRKEVADFKVKAEEFENLQVKLTKTTELLNSKVEIVELKDRKIKSLQSNINILRDASSHLDGQLREFETILERTLKKLKATQDFNGGLENDNQKMRNDFKECRIELNEAKSLRHFTEKKLASTEDSMKSQTEKKQAEYCSILEQLNLGEKRNAELSREIQCLSEQMNCVQKEKLDFQNQIEKLSSDKDGLGEKMHDLLKTIADVKEEGSSLKTALKATLAKAESYKTQYLCNIEKHVELEQAKHTGDLMLQTRSHQQEKLIDYLRQELNAYQSKKKRTGGVLTPKLNFNVREENHLSKKKAECPYANLRRQMENVEKNNLTPVSRMTRSLPQPRKENCILLKQKQIENFGDKITEAGKCHSFIESLCQSTKLCAGCSEPIYKRSWACTCHTCKNSFHIGCSVTAGNTCSINSQDCGQDADICKVDTIANILASGPQTENLNVRGWVKVQTATMNVVERRFVIIEADALALALYQSEHVAVADQLVESFPLNQKTLITFCIQPTYLSNTTIPKNEIPFVMKINFNDHHHDQDASFLYMFHSNKKEKRYWTRAIMKISRGLKISSDFNQTENTTCSELSYLQSSRNGENKENHATATTKTASSPMSTLAESALRLIETDLCVDERPKKLYVNCVYMLPHDQKSPIYLLGCDDGLYSLKLDAKSKPLKIEGPGATYQIEVVNSANVAIFIEGSQRTVSTVIFDLLQNCVKTASTKKFSLKPEGISQAKDCYLFATGYQNGATLVAAASPNLLQIFKLSDFKLTMIKQIIVKDCITTMLMTPNTLLFGNHNVYEVDMKTFEVEEFLDTTDDSLYYVQLINESYGNYPVAILDVTANSKEMKGESEYLICFQDMGVFVDRFGRRSRDGDVVWSQVPISFEYQHPYLFIFHFTSVEVQRLDANTYTKSSSAVTTRPLTRYHPLVSKCAANYAGKGRKGVVLALHEARATRIFELSLSTD